MGSSSSTAAGKLAGLLPAPLRAAGGDSRATYPRHKPGRAPYQGVGVDLLYALAAEVRKQLPDVEDPTTQQVCDVVLAATRAKRCAYQDLFVGRQRGSSSIHSRGRSSSRTSSNCSSRDNSSSSSSRSRGRSSSDSSNGSNTSGGVEKGEPLVAPATVYVVHAWQSSFRTTLDCMLRHARTHPHAYFWLDLLADNLHRTSGTPPPQAWLAASLRRRIRSIGSLLLCLPGHDDRAPLGRAWCVYELACALVGGNTNVVLAMPAAEKALLQRALMVDFEGTVAAWTGYRVADALSSDAATQTRLQQAMASMGEEPCTASTSELDLLVREQLRFWLLTVALDTVSQSGVEATWCTDLPALFTCIGTMLSEFGDCDAALGFFKRALAAQSLGNQAQALRGAAMACHRLGDLTEALEHYNCWLAVTTDAPASVVPPSERATVFMCIGAIHEARGSRDELGLALTVYRSTLRIELAAAAPDPARVGTTYHSLARACSAAGRHGEALAWYGKAVSLPFEAATSLRGVAQAHLSLGQTGPALEAYNRVLQLQTSAHGECDAEVASALGDIIRVLEMCGEHDKALVLHSRCVDIRLAAHGHEHPLTAIAYNNMAKAHALVQDYPAAMDCYRTSLEIKLATVGECDLETAVAYSNMATVYSKQGNPDMAERFFRKSLDIKVAALGASHPETAAGYRYLAQVHLDTARHEQALHLFHKALDICYQALGPAHADTALTLYQMAGVYASVGDTRREGEHLRQAQCISRQALAATSRPLSVAA